MSFCSPCAVNALIHASIGLWRIEEAEPSMTLSTQSQVPNILWSQNLFIPSMRVHKSCKPQPLRTSSTRRAWEQVLLRRRCLGRVPLCVYTGEYVYTVYIRVITGLCWDNGKENENYYLGLGCRVYGCRVMTDCGASQMILYLTTP